MVTEERAVELVEALLSKEHQAALAKHGKWQVAVLEVEEHALGWLVFWQSMKYIRSRDPADVRHLREPPGHARNPARGGQVVGRSVAGAHPTTAAAVPAISTPLAFAH
ncbi:MAG: YrhB domain-containing protein [Micromonospora sp.]